jgi:biuret amidohydrolase
MQTLLSCSTLELPAQPFAYSFSPQHTALVIIDMQRDFLEKGGFGESLGNDVTRLQAIVPALQKVLETWRNHGLTVIHTREVHKPDLSDCPPAKRNRGKPSLRIGDVGPMGRILVEGEASSEIIPELLPLQNELIINKPGKGAFYNTDLQHQLRERDITHLIITGVTTEVCVQTTMREANDRGYDCLLLEDCTESYFPEFKKVTLEMICAQGGIVGWTSSSSALLDVLL